MRITKIWLTIILICCTALFFVACQEERLATSISLNEYTAENPLEFTMGNFAYDNYTVTLTYDDGETEELALTEEMISETDKLKFYQEGKNTITISYNGAETSIVINVLRNKFSDNIVLNDFTATYNGTPYTVEVVGDIPGGTKILYPEGNTFQNAGEYDMSAILQCDGYETKVLKARVKIEKATYDLSNAKLYPETVVYDRDSHGLVIKGQPVLDEKGNVSFYNNAELPQGVRVNYTITKIVDGMGNEIPKNKQQLIEGNKATDAGVYEVRAQFRGDASNYMTISDSVANLTIERNVYDLSNVTFIDGLFTYTGKNHALSIPEDAKLPTDVVVAYQIKQLKDANGDAVVDEFKSGNTASKVGVYLVKVNFIITGKNAQNYTASPYEKEAYLTVERAVYDMSYVGFFDEAVMYTGKPCTLNISADVKIPSDVVVAYQIKQIKDADGNDVNEDYKLGNSATNAGVYSVKVTFSIDENSENAENYTTAPYEMVSTLTIFRGLYDEIMDKATLESELWYEFEDDKVYEIHFDYDLPEGVSPIFKLTDENGTVIDGELVVSTNQDDNATSKTRYTYKFTVNNPGKYSCVLTFKHENDNYDDIKLELTATIDISSVA